MLILKNVGCNESIGVIKRVFDLGYDIIQNEMNNLEVDCDTAFNLCVLYYNEFYHSEYNKNNMSEYSALTDFYNDDKISLDEWLKRIQLMFQICQYYEYTLSFDVERMKICICNESKRYYKPSEYQYHYNTMSEFALGWITTCITTNDKMTVWTNEDLNILRKMSGLPIPKDKNQIQDSFNFEFFVTDEEIEEGLIQRYEILDEDDLYQAIDDCEMDINDYCIATFKPSDNISFNIFTTHNLYNIYIDKVVIYEDGSCDTVEMNNITSDTLDWNNKKDIIQYFLGMNY